MIENVDPKAINESFSRVKVKMPCCEGTLIFIVENNEHVEKQVFERVKKTCIDCSAISRRNCTGIWRKDQYTWEVMR